MNSDDFEKRLRQQTFREVPANWRKEILDAASVKSTLRDDDSAINFVVARIVLAMSSSLGQPRRSLARNFVYQFFEPRGNNCVCRTE